MRNWVLKTSSRVSVFTVGLVLVAGCATTQPSASETKASDAFVPAASQAISRPVVTDEASAIAYHEALFAQNGCEMEDKQISAAKAADGYTTPFQEGTISNLLRTTGHKLMADKRLVMQSRGQQYFFISTFGRCANTPVAKTREETRQFILDSLKTYRNCAVQRSTLAERAVKNGHNATVFADALKYLELVQQIAYFGELVTLNSISACKR